uniref:Leptin receptor n=1 Tax=Cyprinus carpio TaxID=7962 RepID=A0A8C1K9I2_CYPCA
MLALLVNFITISQGLAALSPSDGRGGVYEDLKWKALLCCELPFAQTLDGGLSEHPPVGQCQLLNATKPEFSKNCLDILCWLEGEWTNLICNAKSYRAAAAASLLTIRPQLVVQMNVLSDETNHAAQCAGEEIAMCSISLHGNDANVSLTISISLNETTAVSPKMQVSTHHLRKNCIMIYNFIDFCLSVRPSVRSVVLISYIPAEVFTTPGSEITVSAVFHNRSWRASKAVWMLNGQVKIPESQYRVINEQVSAVTVTVDEPGFDTLMCCHQWGERFKCIIAYAKIYTEGMFNADITCQSKNSEVDTMSCEWNKSAWAQVRLLYRQYTSMCETISEIEGSEEAEESMSLVKECPSGAGDHRECTLRNLSLFSCYKIWLEVEGGRGKVRSFPVYVLPIDCVKPSSPTVLEATTLPNKTLSVSWRRPHLPVYDMQYELRFVALRGMANTQWKVIGPLFEPQAEIQLEESCVQFEVDVRCRRLNGSGYWSDWSTSYTSVVYNRKAPEMGPDFWRIIQEDPVKLRSVTNVTLIIKQPVLAGDPYSCVEGLVFEHQASGRAVWSNETTLVQFHSFQWRKEAHTVTVISRNTLGISTRNRNITLLHQPKRRVVRSFSVVANASCVYLSWSLLSNHPVPQSFVIEWLDLNKDPEQDMSLTNRLQWVRVQSTSRDLSLCRMLFYLIFFIYSSHLPISV